MSFAEYFPDGRRHNIPGAVDAEGKMINAGFDTVESVQKVAMMVWNPNLLQWERGTQASGGGGGSSSSGPVTKRFDISPSVVYVGEAAVGTATNAAGWGITKTLFDASGNATASLYGVGTWDNRAALAYT